MEEYFRNKGYQPTSTKLFLGQELPAVESFDWLIIMGGPMGVYDEEDFPFLKTEKEFIKEAVFSGKTVLGICLGAQLLACVLGAKVYKNNFREIGWFPVSLKNDLKNTLFEGFFPETTEAFHWHGDTFEIPAGAIHLASSEACPNQGFLFGEKVVGLQFHLETTPDSARALIENCGNELDGSRFVLSELEIMANAERFSGINKVMETVLQQMEQW